MLLIVLAAGRFGDRSGNRHVDPTLLEGRAGMRQLASRLKRWRVGARWYAVALLTTPLFLLAILWPLSALIEPAFAPRFQWALFAIGVVAGRFEEIGWTGFATPRLLTRQNTPDKTSRTALWAVVATFPPPALFSSKAPIHALPTGRGRRRSCRRSARPTGSRQAPARARRRYAPGDIVR